MIPLPLPLPLALAVTLPLALVAYAYNTYSMYPTPTPCPGSLVTSRETHTSSLHTMHNTLTINTLHRPATASLLYHVYLMYYMYPYTLCLYIEDTTPSGMPTVSIPQTLPLALPLTLALAVPYLYLNPTGISWHAMCFILKREATANKLLTLTLESDRLLTKSQHCLAIAPLAF